MAGVMTQGMVTAVRDGTMDYPQPSPTGEVYAFSKDAVQRPNVGGGFNITGS